MHLVADFHIFTYQTTILASIPPQKTLKKSLTAERQATPMNKDQRLKTIDQ